MILKELKTSKYLINIFFITFLLMICFLAFYKNIAISSFQHEDKIHHVLTFFILSFFSQISFKNTKISLKFLALFTFAILIEIIQYFIGRQANIYDFISSIIGICLFIISNKFYNKIRYNIC